METLLIDFNHWKGQQIGEQIASNLYDINAYYLISLLNPKFGVDGNQYYYMIGNIQDKDCIVGFGNTPREAMYDFCNSFNTNTIK